MVERHLQNGQVVDHGAQKLCDGLGEAKRTRPARGLDEKVGSTLERGNSRPRDVEALVMDVAKSSVRARRRAQV
jgi:hypothetical protein